MKRLVRRSVNKGLIAATALFVCAAALFIFVLSRTDATSRARQEEQLEQALIRAAVTCYAVEGRYPEDLDYISEKYGVTVDAARYTVSYDIIGSNLMPVINVSAKEDGR